MSTQMSHDQFFRHSFSRIEIARNYLQEYLPKELALLINLEKMTLIEGTFVDVEMKKHHTDLLYTAPLFGGDPISIYFLFEHKAQPDREIGFQLLRYMVQIWEMELRNRVDPRPIIPLVIYHGEKRWHGMTSFQEGLDIPELFRPYVPDFTYILRDFSYRSDESIRGEVWLRVSLAVLRAVSSPTLRDELFDLIGLLKELRDYKTGVEFIRAIMYYVSRATDRIEWQDLEIALVEQGIDGDEIMTIAQELQQIGYEKGLEKGVATLAKSTINILMLRFGTLPEGLEWQIEQLTDINHLEALIPYAAVTPSVEAFVDRMEQIGTGEEEK